MRGRVALALGRIYQRWIVAKSERDFERFLRGEIVRASRGLKTEARRKLLRPEVHP